MASQELETVINMMKTTSPLESLDVFKMREVMAQAEALYQAPDDVTYQEVSAGGVPAEWTAAEGAQPSKAVVYLHGGGYTIGGIASHRGLCTNLAKAARLRVLNVGYRLAPESPYPAAVDDAVAAYRYVVDSGVAPAKIAIAGDSAGGGLTLAALIALRDAGDPLPAAGVCISPWTDLTLSGETIKTNAEIDPMVGKELLEVMSGHYLAEADPRSPTASPLFADLSGLPPLLIHVGTAEVLLDDARRLAERARAAGVDVTLEPWEDMIHVWHTFADMLPEGRQAIERIAEYLAGALA